MLNVGMDSNTSQNNDQVVNSESEENTIDAEVSIDPSPRTKRLLRQTELSSKPRSNTPATHPFYGEGTCFMAPIDYKLNNDDTITMESSQR